MPTPGIYVRLPMYLREAIEKVTEEKGKAEFIVAAIQEKLARTPIKNKPSVGQEESK